MASSTDSSCAGFVLAGGRSSRMGQEKALLELCGTPLVVRAVRLVMSVCPFVAIIGPPEHYAHLGFPVIADEQPSLGPLGGILTALGRSTADWNLVVACDLPYLSAEWLRFLVGRARASRARVVLPVSAAGPEPLCAVYHRDCATEIRAQVERGVLKVTRALENAGVEQILPSEILPFDARGLLFQNLNSPEDYERARADLET
jgi:molybdopterin-guanine dinucleotide biosynthesis protein A